MNEYLQTRVDNIYTIGDIINTLFLVHVPGCVFTNPEIANVGKRKWQFQK